MRRWWNIRSRSNGRGGGGLLPVSRRLGLSMGWLVLLLVLLTGCVGGNTRQESWPGPMAHDDVLYVANTDRVQAFESSDSREVLWSWYPGEKPDTAVGFYATPVFDAERRLLMVAGFKSRTVYALRLSDNPTDTPALAWSFPGTQEAEGAKGQYVGSGAIAGSLFLVGNGDGVLYALNLENGSLIWSFTTAERIWATPLVNAGIVYVASLDHHLYALDLEDGTEVWSVETRGAIAGSPVYAGGAIWVADFGDQIYRIDPQDGEVLWAFTEGVNWFWATPLVDAEQIYFADVDGNVFAFAVESGALQWKTSLDDIFRGRGVLSPDGDKLFLPGYEHGRIYALDTATGDKLPWGELPENPGRMPSSLATDGERIYAMPILIDKSLQAFELAGGKLLWSYPQGEE